MGQFLIVLLVGLLILVIFGWDEWANHFAYYQLLDNMNATRNTLYNKAGVTLYASTKTTGRPSSRMFHLRGDHINLHRSPIEMMRITNRVISGKILRYELQMLTEKEFAN